MAAEMLLNLAAFTHRKPPAMPPGLQLVLGAPFCCGCWLIGVGVTWLERFHGMVGQLGLFHTKTIQALFALLHYPSYRKGYQFVV